MVTKVSQLISNNQLPLVTFCTVSYKNQLRVRTNTTRRTVRAEFSQSYFSLTFSEIYPTIN